MTENCDDSNEADGDGCSSTCQNENPAVYDCSTAGQLCSEYCGDGIITVNANVTETCDDNDQDAGDGCDSTCTIEDTAIWDCPNNSGTGGDCSKWCGNGVVDDNDFVTETCDDSNEVSGDGCSSTCQSEVPVCGNGILETGETCDVVPAHDGCVACQL